MRRADLSLRGVLPVMCMSNFVSCGHLKNEAAYDRFEVLLYRKKP